MCHKLVPLEENLRHSFQSSSDNRESGCVLGLRRTWAAKSPYFSRVARFMPSVMNVVGKFFTNWPSFPIRQYDTFHTDTTLNFETCLQDASSGYIHSGWLSFLFWSLCRLGPNSVLGPPSSHRRNPDLHKCSFATRLAAQVDVCCKSNSCTCILPISL